MQLDELVYNKAVGVMELIGFYKKATPEQSKEMKSHIAAGRNKHVVDLLHKVTGSKLDDKTFGESITEAASKDETKFVFKTPAMGNQPRQVKGEFTIKKDAAKSGEMLYSGHEKEHFDFYHNDVHIGHVSSYSVPRNSTKTGMFNKHDRKWQISMKAGHHTMHPVQYPFTQKDIGSKNDAFNTVGQYHPSNTRE